MINPKSTSVSSMGEIITENAKQLAQYMIDETIEYVPTDSLAMKILRDGRWPFSDKQLWCISYELIKNKEYVEMIEKEEKELAQREAIKKAVKKAKKESKKAGEAMRKEQAEKNSELKEGDKVNHPQFGDGIVKSIDDKIIVVNFGGEEKKLMTAFTRFI